jgi:hypothetical protein
MHAMCEYTPVGASNSSRAGYAFSSGLISQQLAALSPALTRTADTGQTNFVTGFQQSTTWPSAGYEIYQLTDSLAATKPIYLRLDYANTNGLNLSVGTATNGAGTLSGVTTGSLGINGYGQSTATTPRYCLASSDGSYLSLMLNLQNGAAATYDSAGGFVVERTRDGDGTPNGNGYIVWRWTAAADTATAGTPAYAGTLSRIYDTAASQPAATFEINGYVPFQQAVSAATPYPTFGGYTLATMPPPAGAVVPGYPVYGYAGQTPQGASKALMLAYPSDVPRLQPLTLTHYGAATTWMALPGVQVAVVSTPTSPGSTPTIRYVCPLLRWE